MQRALLILSMAALIPGCESKAPVELKYNFDVPSLAKGVPGGGTEFASRTALPAFNPGVHGEAYATNRAGTLIGGYSWDQNGYMHPVTWSLQNGAWRITAYPWDASATSAKITGVNELGDKAGTFFPASATRAVIWNAAGAFTVLGCNQGGEANAISSNGQVVVGAYRVQASATPTLWRPGQCRESLPPLVLGASGVAYAVNGDGTIVGGNSAGKPVRWTRINGAWQVQQLDSRQGNVMGANTAGDLTGYAIVPCSAEQCSQGYVWFVGGGSQALPTLGGQTTAPRSINSTREVVGLSTLANGSGVPFIWSETLGIRQLPASNGGWAFAVSDVRADGTRLVAGAGGKPFSAQAWVVRNP